MRERAKLNEIPTTTVDPSQMEHLGSSHAVLLGIPCWAIPVGLSLGHFVRESAMGLQDREWTSGNTGSRFQVNVLQKA